MRHFVFVVLACMLFISCSSMTDIYLNSLSTEEMDKIGDIEGAFIIYWNEKDLVQLDRIEKGVSEMLRSAILAKPLKGMLLAMNAELQYYMGKPALAAEYIAASTQADPMGEHLFIARYIIEKDPVKKRQILEEGYKKAETRTFIALFLAEIYFAQENYKQALAMYDEVLRLLPMKFHVYYQKNRDAAFQLAGQPAASRDMAATARIGVLDIGQTITTILSNTPYFDPVTVRKDITAKELLEKLYEYNYLQNAGLLVESPILRRDLSYLLLHIVVALENDPLLLTRASTKYRDNGRKSPIADVSVSDFYFDAAFVLVEREIMDLPDGSSFDPDKTVSGLELIRILDRVRLRYGK